MYIHTYLDLSSIDVAKYSAPLSDFASNLPQTSLCTISSRFVARLPPDSGVMDIVVGNGHGDTSSNLGRD